MDAASIARSTQEQACAAWVDQLNQLRLDELVAKLMAQDVNLAGALNQLQELKDFVGDPTHILGSVLTKHGEIAEQAQVNIANARKIIEGLRGEYTFDGVPRTSPIDYLHNGIPIQSKFVQANFSLNAIEQHFGKYPNFIKMGGKYVIPKDFYEIVQKYANMPVEQGNKLAGAERTAYLAIKKFLQESGISLDNIEPSILTYKEIQSGQVGDTIQKEEKSIKKTDQKRRDKFHEESKPSLQEGLQATAVSAGIEGGMSFCLAVAQKFKSGKRLGDFTEQDWAEVGIDTAEGTGKGAIRGASVYALTNFTATPAAVASAMVTASFGVVAQARSLRYGTITKEEFVENSEVVCLDVTVSAIASLMGQTLIPVPVLGAVVGNVVGMFMYGIAKDNLSAEEQALIFEFNESTQRRSEQLDARYRALIELLKQEFARFKSVVALAFDPDINAAFRGSVRLARQLGCPEEKILKNKADVDSFFLH